MITLTTLAVAGWILAAVLMLALWAWHFRLRNAGIVDAGWTAAVAGLALLDAALGSGAPLRRAAIGGMAALWGGRLTFYLLTNRVFGRPEDGRYAELRKSWGKRAPLRFLWFFQAQALAALFFSMPALLASMNPAPALTRLELGAIGLWIAAFLGEAASDRQLERFKADPANRAHTCRIGLWKYSRHPNYFFEWLIWVAYAIFAISSPYGVFAIACPVVMLVLLFKVTGIPATEAQALRSRGEDYRRYQETTSVFVPRWPKTTGGHRA